MAVGSEAVGSAVAKAEVAMVVAREAGSVAADSEAAAMAAARVETVETVVVALEAAMAATVATAEETVAVGAAVGSMAEEGKALQAARREAGAWVAELVVG